MLDDLLRAATAVVATPPGLIAGLWRDRLAGRRAILFGEVAPEPELEARSALIRAIRRAAADPRVVSVVLRVAGSPGGWAAAADVRAAIAAARAAGTEVVALLENPGNGALWIASACDRVVMVPTGQVIAAGVGAELIFARAALERVGLRVDLEAAGAYKSAGEAWTRTHASPENREATAALVQGLHGALVRDLAASRGRTVEQVERALAQAPLAAEEAREAGLVDAVAYPDELRARLEEEHGPGARLVALEDWTRWDDRARRLTATAGPPPGVAVLHLQGPIVLEDRGPGMTLRARHVVPILRELRERDAIRAVVLHVSSPGGGAYASDLIWREVSRIVAEKPVVAAFEDVAASGGFYLSAPATRILARSTTITGSIGVFGGKLVASEALRRVGLRHEAVLGGANADMFNPSAPFTASQRARFRESLQRTYDGFVQRVADGRGRPVDAIEPHCRGRVWTGEEALARGLIDAVGDLDEAVALAAELAGLPRWRRARVDLSGHPQPSWAQRRVQEALRDAVPAGAARILGPLAPGPVAALLAASPGEALALWPVDLGPA